MERKEAIEIVRKLYNESLFLKKDKEAIVTLIPELEDSEDERIRKGLIAIITDFDSLYLQENYSLSREEVITWLEKQGEQTAEWSKEDERNFDIIYGIIYNSCIAEDASRLIEWLKSLKDRVGCEANCTTTKEWSEEDERLREYCINAINGIHYYSPENKQELVGWLKSLRPQNWTKEDKERYISCLQRLGTGNPEQPETINSKWFKEHVYPQNRWKPSLAQLNALSIVSKGNASDDIEAIVSLYNDLKKLREE